MKIKEWKYDQIMSEVTKYGDLWMGIYVERDSDNFGMPKVDENGYVTIESRCEVLKETEKAVYMNIADTWKTWIPKSCIA